MPDAVQMDIAGPGAEGAEGGRSPEGDCPAPRLRRPPDPDPRCQHGPAAAVRDRLRILKAADACKKPGEVGALLRREGLYSSLLTNSAAARGGSAARDAGAPSGAELDDLEAFCEQLKAKGIEFDVERPRAPSPRALGATERQAVSITASGSSTSRPPIATLLEEQTYLCSSPTPQAPTGELTEGYDRVSSTSSAARWSRATRIAPDA